MAEAYWLGSTAGDWTDTSKWTPPIPPYGWASGSGNAVYFGQYAPAGPVSIAQPFGSDITIGNFIFRGNYNWTFEGGGYGFNIQMPTGITRAIYVSGEINFGCSITSDSIVIYEGEVPGGRITLNGQNNAGFSVAGATLVIGNDTTLGSQSLGISSTGKLDSIGDRTISNNLTILSTMGFAGLTGNLRINGDVTLYESVTDVTVDAGTLTFGGIVSRWVTTTGFLNKKGPGALVLANANNTYEGSWVVEDGTLRVTAAGAVKGPIFIGTTGVLSLGADSVVTTLFAVSAGRVVADAFSPFAGAVTIAGTASLSTGSAQAGRLTLSAGLTLADGGGLTIGDSTIPTPPTTGFTYAPTTDFNDTKIDIALDPSIFNAPGDYTLVYSPVALTRYAGANTPTWTRMSVFVVTRVTPAGSGDTVVIGGVTYYAVVVTIA